MKTIYNSLPSDLPLLHFDGADLPGCVGRWIEGLTGKRADANETAFFARELESVYAQTYDVKYPEFMARKLIPVDTRPPSGAESFTYSQFDKKVQAQVVHNYAQDFPTAEVTGKQFNQGIVSLGDSFQYSIQDLRAAAMAGRPLESMKASAARWGMEYKLEVLAAVGDANEGLTGFINAPFVNATTKVSQNNAGSTSVTWPALIADALAKGNLTAAAQEILKDVNAMGKKVYTQSKKIFSTTTLAIPTGAYAVLASTPIAPGFGNTKTLLQFILESSPWLKEIEAWPQLDAVASSVLSGAGGNGVVLAYDKNPEVVQLVIPQEFEQFAPQPRGMAFIVPCHMRTGAVTVRYPIAMTNMVGCVNSDGS